jgi:mRNA-degrading endonuclease RelE of RelBE toxin-antitoxin system
MFKILLSSYSNKFLKKLEKSISKRIICKIKELQNEPFHQIQKELLEKKKKYIELELVNIEYYILYSLKIKKF